MCTACQKQLIWRGVWACPSCHRTTERGEPCQGCEHLTALSHITACSVYSEQTLNGRLVRLFKYDYLESVAKIWEPLVRDFCRQYPFFGEEVTLIVPVPLHVARYAERGFNQSEIIAQILSRVFARPAVQALVRVKQTAQQARLTKKERIENMQGAFACNPSCTESLLGATVLLVDDVYTTGSTLQACAEVLRQKGGVGDVQGFCLARG